jgi:PAS domain S-box-containing protein
MNQNNNYAILERNISDIIYHFDFIIGSYAFLNRAGRRYFGIKINEIPIQGDKILNNIHKDDFQRIKRLHNTILTDSLQNIEIEYRIKNSENEYRWFSDKWNIIKDEKGNIIGYEGIMRDITDKKNIELELIKKNKYMELINTLLVDSLKTNSFDNFCDNLLKSLGEMTKVSRTYIFTIRKDDLFMDNTHEWCNINIEPQIKNLQNQKLSDFPLWINTLKNNNILKARIIEKDLPEEVHDVLKSQDIKSILVVPLFLNDRLWGFFGLDECLSYKEWSDLEIELMRSLSNIISLAFKLRYNK